jgi:hypothetical protein
LELYRRSLRIREELSARDPINLQLRRDVAQSDSSIAEILAKQGDLRAAIENYLRSAGIYEAMSNKDPANLDWRRDLASVAMEFGDAYERSDAKKSRQWYSRSRTIMLSDGGRSAVNASEQARLKKLDLKLGAHAAAPSPP